MEQLITIELFGQPYTFKADAEADSAQEVAALLAQEVAKVQTRESGQSPYMPKLTVLILAALNIANQAVQLKKSNGEFAHRITERCERIERLLDDGFGSMRSSRPSWG